MFDAGRVVCRQVSRQTARLLVFCTVLASPSLFVEALGSRLLVELPKPKPPILRAGERALLPVAWLAMGETLPARVEPDSPTRILARILAASLVGQVPSPPGSLARRWVTWLLPEPSRKPLERIAMELWLSRHWSPEELSVCWIRNVYLGEGQRGLAQGALVRFGVPLEALSVAQMARLMAVAQSPSRSDALRYPEHVIAAQKLWLSRLQEAGEFSTRR